MARAILWTFTVISLVAWLIGKESFLIFYSLFGLLVFTEILNKIINLEKDVQ